MSKTTFVILGLMLWCSASSQDCLDKVAKQAVEIDSLKKNLKVVKDSSELYNVHQIKIEKKLRDSMVILKSNQVSLGKVTAENKLLITHLQGKRDSINQLINQVTVLNEKISSDRLLCERRMVEESEKAKKEVLAAVISSYKNKTFDQLITSSTGQTVRRDLQVIGNITELRQVLTDLDVYFQSLEILSRKLDTSENKKSLERLSQIKQKSILLDKLKENLRNYQSFTDGLKETLAKIAAVDKNEVASGMSVEIQKGKLNKIMGFVSSYVFAYDFNFVDLPILSEIVLEVYRRKQPNPDAEIKDLLQRLQ